MQHWVVLVGVGRGKRFPHFLGNRHRSTTVRDPNHGERQSDTINSGPFVSHPVLVEGFSFGSSDTYSNPGIHWQVIQRFIVLPSNMSHFCKCRTHCSRYNAETKTFTGGQLVNRSTAFQHRKDDTRSRGLGNFATRVASTILDDGSSLGLSHQRGDLSTLSPLATETLPHELLTIEREVNGRVTWAPTIWALVFAADPVPDQDFEDPLSAPNYTPNSGPHALRLSHQRNLAFIENESRLFEIIHHLSSLTGHSEQCEVLTDMAFAGLQKMIQHKRHEWNRQRKTMTVIENGYTIVHTGDCTTICETRLC